VLSYILLSKIKYLVDGDSAQVDGHSIQIKRNDVAARRFGFHAQELRERRDQLRQVGGRVQVCIDVAPVGPKYLRMKNEDQRSHLWMHRYRHVVFAISSQTAFFQFLKDHFGKALVAKVA
jgi:hypothetical protein